MILQVPISEDIEQRVRDEAAAAGQDVGEFVALVLSEHLAAATAETKSAPLPTEADELAFLEQIALRHPDAPRPADYSRETIYADRR